MLAPTRTSAPIWTIGAGQRQRDRGHRPPARSSLVLITLSRAREHDDAPVGERGHAPAPRQARPRPRAAARGCRRRRGRAARPSSRDVGDRRPRPRTGHPRGVPAPSTSGRSPESTSLDASARRRGARARRRRRPQVVTRGCSRRRSVTQKTRRPEVATDEMPLPAARALLADRGSSALRTSTGRASPCPRAARRRNAAVRRLVDRVDDRAMRDAERRDRGRLGDRAARRERLRRRRPEKRHREKRDRDRQPSHDRIIGPRVTETMKGTVRKRAAAGSRPVSRYPCLHAHHELRPLREGPPRRRGSASSSASPSRRRTSPRSSPTSRSLTDAELLAKTAEFKQRIENGESLDEILFEAFAAVREARKRESGQRLFDVQLMGGIVLHEGDIAEMKTGEGKTFVASLPLYLNALSRRQRAPRDRQRLPREARRRVEPARLRPARRHRWRDREHDAVRAAARGLRGRHHLRDELRVRLRLPPRQHGRRARGHRAARARRSRSSTRSTRS